MSTKMIIQWNINKAVLYGQNDVRFFKKQDINLLFP